MEFDYLSNVFNEVLRIEPPISMSANQDMSEDVYINDDKGNEVLFKKGFGYFINFREIHHDPH